MKDEHFENLEAVLHRLLERGVRVRREKCSFFQEKLYYLGHVISANDIQTSPEKTAALMEAPEPNNKQQLLSFLGIVNYYGKFVPRPSTLAHPLLQAAEKKARLGAEMKPAASLFVP